jgi:hypothetical protein
MTQAMRRIVRVKTGGIIEVRAPELAPGAVAEVIVLTESAESQTEGQRADELAALLKETQALPQARIVSEKEIEAEIAAYRAAGA